MGSGRCVDGQYARIPRLPPTPSIIVDIFLLSRRRWNKRWHSRHTITVINGNHFFHHDCQCQWWCISSCQVSCWFESVGGDLECAANVLHARHTRKNTHALCWYEQTAITTIAAATSTELLLLLLNLLLLPTTDRDHESCDKRITNNNHSLH